MSTNRKLLHYRSWLVPITLIVGIAALFPAIYLSATVDPQGHLAGFPVGLVVEPQAAAEGPDLATAAADAFEDNADDTLAVTRMTATQMSAAMRHDHIAGAVVIPAAFNQSIASLLPGATTVSIPTVTILSNAGDGGLSNGLLVGNLMPLLKGVAEGIGGELTAGANATGMPPANVALLAQPFHIASQPFEPLPANAGLGTSAFYFSLVLVLIGFIGASLVGPLVDSALGFAPSEVGPLVERRPYVPISRIRTLVAKFAILVAAAPLAAGVAQAVATGPVGIPISRPAALWLFSTAVIAAVGTSALAVFAIFGNGIGSLVNTVFFIALAMVSSGGTVPLAATPPFFRWLAGFEPFRPIVDGVRALFYFDGRPDAGLANAWSSVGVGAAIGITLGLTVTALYGRVPAFSRHPRAETSAAQSQPVRSLA